MRRGLLLVGALLASGCQTYGAMSSPNTLKAGDVRVAVIGSYHRFQVTDERLTAFDPQLALQYGVSDSTELDFLVLSLGADFRLKEKLIDHGRLVVSADVGAGIFSAAQANTTQLYLPLDLLAGVRLAPDITPFVGGRLQGQLSLDSPGRGAGFNQGVLGAMGGGVVGVALESKALTFIPQINVMTPLMPGTSGVAVEVSLGLGTTIGNP
jgi:hypothetical protein